MYEFDRFEGFSPQKAYNLGRITAHLEDRGLVVGCSAGYMCQKAGMGSAVQIISATVPYFLGLYLSARYVAREKDKVRAETDCVRESSSQTPTP